MRSVGGQSAFHAHVVTVGACSQSGADISSLEPRCGWRADPVIEASQRAARYASTFCDVPRVHETLLRDGRCCLAVTVDQQPRAQSQAEGGEYLTERRLHNETWRAALLASGQPLSLPARNPIGSPAAPRADSGLFDVETRSTRRLRQPAQAVQAPWVAQIQKARWSRTLLLLRNPHFDREVAIRALNKVLPGWGRLIRRRSLVASGCFGDHAVGFADTPSAQTVNLGERTARRDAEQLVLRVGKDAPQQGNRLKLHPGGPAAVRRVQRLEAIARPGGFSRRHPHALELPSACAVRRPASSLAGSRLRTGASEDSATSIEADAVVLKALPRWQMQSTARPLPFDGCRSPPEPDREASFGQP